MRTTIAMISLAVLLSGCTHPAVIDSSKSSNTNFQPQNTLIVVHIPKRYLDELSTFEKAFSGALRNCKIQSSYLYIPAMERDLSLNDETAEQKSLVLNALKQHNPDSLLEISAQSTTSPGETFNGEYALTLQKTPNFEKIWNGHASVYNAGSVDFAATLAKNLQRDGVLKNCQVSN